MKKVTILSIIICTCFYSFAQNIDIIWDTITFEEPYSYLTIDTSSQNIWQVGEPNKIFFDSAYSIYNAIVTDTINYYPANNNANFDLKIGEFNFFEQFPFSICIEIKHKFDTDTLQDGGFISVSYDEGLTWMNIIKDTTDFWDDTPMNNGYNLYSNSDSLYNGELGFSGHSNNWVTTSFCWFFYPVKNIAEFPGDTIIVRFTFISDSIGDNKEGWIIDNIKLYSYDLGGSIYDKNSLDFQLIPNPITEYAKIKITDYQKALLRIFSIDGKIVKNQEYYHNQDITIKKNELKSGSYFISIKTDTNQYGIKKLIIN